jgi:hypothetical protein
LVRNAAEGLDGRHVDDAAAVGLIDHPRGERLRAQEHVAKVDGIERVPVLLVGVEEPQASIEVVPHVIDEHVDAAALGDRGIGE